MDANEIKSLKRLFSAVRKLPAFAEASLHVRSIRDHGHCLFSSQGYIIRINKALTYSEAVYTLAHELAHILVDMENKHGAIFGVMEEALRNVLFILTQQLQVEINNSSCPSVTAQPDREN